MMQQFHISTTNIGNKCCKIKFIILPRFSMNHVTGNDKTMLQLQSKKELWKLKKGIDRYPAMADGKAARADHLYP
jgi:hypothetical protein